MMLRSLLLGFACMAAPLAAKPADPKTSLDGLLTAEQALSNAAVGLAPGKGIASMLADDAILFTRSGPIRGRDAAEAHLVENPANRGTHASWKPIRGGVSADGRHGFTVGYLTVAGGDPKTARRRYLAYWTRAGDDWRVSLLKQAYRVDGESDAADQPPALPTRGARLMPARTQSLRKSLIAAEQAFSDRAQVVGVRQAFQEFGRDDAIHLVTRDGFAIGLEAIGKSMADERPGPTPIHWSASDAFAASSGDLGVTIGTIRLHQPPPPGQPSEIPYFTIWMREHAGHPWRYIAE